MKGAKKAADPTNEALLKELEELRKQARQASRLEAEAQALKKTLSKQDRALQNKEKQLQEKQKHLQKKEQQLADQEKTIKDISQKWENSEREIEKLKYRLFEATWQLEQWKKKFLGSSKERFVPAAADQLVLALELDLLKTEGEAEIAKVEYLRVKPSGEEKNKPVRMHIPAHLTREVTEIHPEGDLSGLICIGKQITERLEMTPASFKAIQEVRYKYKHPQTGEISYPALPERVQHKGMAGPALLADILVSKYVDALPITRQISRFDRLGIRLSKSTINGWIRSTCEFLEPLHDELIAIVKASSYLQADETPVKMLDGSKESGIRKAYHWVFYSPPDKAVLFDFQPGRDKASARPYLKDFRGTLQTDDYPAYYQFEGPNVKMAACMAHVRRKFSDALDNDPMATVALAEFQQLYAIEHNARLNRLDPQAIQRERKTKAAPVLLRLKKWVEGYRVKTTPSSPMGKAIGYFLNNWNKLMTYLNDGHILIDNNPVERSLRKVSIGRKNYLFHGSHEGGCWAAMLYSFFGTCKLNDVNPLQWLSDVLTRMPGYSKEALAELLPQNWKARTAC